MRPLETLDSWMRTQGAQTEATPPQPMPIRPKSRMLGALTLPRTDSMPESPRTLGETRRAIDRETTLARAMAETQR